jgi:hypothetical protein
LKRRVVPEYPISQQGQIMRMIPLSKEVVMPMHPISQQGEILKMKMVTMKFLALAPT